MTMMRMIVEPIMNTDCPLSLTMQHGRMNGWTVEGETPQRDAMICKGEEREAHFHCVCRPL